MSENKEFPITSLRDLLVPTAVLRLKTFEAESVTELDPLVNKWVDESQGIIVAISPVTQMTYMSRTVYAIAVTYLPSVEQP